MTAKGIVDLSRLLSPATPVYPGDPPFATSDALRNDPVGFNLKTVTTAMHVGTHLDAPRHYFAKGDGVDRIPLSACVGRAVLLKVTPVEGIVRTADLIAAWERTPVKRPRLLLSTGWETTFGSPTYFTSHPGFEPSLFPFLKDRGVVLLGVDMPSVKYGSADNASCHADLLGAKIVIVESLQNLSLLPDEFFLSAAPLKMDGIDGSPIRAYAIVD
ncbi:MAG: cyclase family protein [Bacillus subtilis]|nr:cyclase family protein [Bacillus subtilis]